MAMPSIRLSPEHSAQFRRAPVNPALGKALGVLSHLNGGLTRLRVADQGCGQLRHFHVFTPFSSELLLVDTQEQLTKPHRDGDAVFTVVEVANSENKRHPSRKVRAIDTIEFRKSFYELDLVACIAVYDVVPRAVRKEVVQAASRNLRRGGYYLVVAPRNDSSILARCTAANTTASGVRKSWIILIT